MIRRGDAKPAADRRLPHLFRPPTARGGRRRDAQRSGLMLPDRHALGGGRLDVARQSGEMDGQIGHLVVRDRVAEAKLQQGANALGQPVGGGFLLLEHRPPRVRVLRAPGRRGPGRRNSADGRRTWQRRRNRVRIRASWDSRSKTRRIRAEWANVSSMPAAPVQAWNRCMARAEASPAGSGGSRRSRRRSVTSVSRSGGISASTCATVAAFPTGTKRLTALSASTGSPGGRGSPDRVRSAPSPARVRLGRARRRC